MLISTSPSCTSSAFSCSTVFSTWGAAWCSCAAVSLSAAGSTTPMAVVCAAGAAGAGVCRNEEGAFGTANRVAGVFAAVEAGAGPTSFVSSNQRNRGAAPFAVVTWRMRSSGFEFF